MASIGLLYPQVDVDLHSVMDAIFGIIFRGQYQPDVKDELGYCCQTGRFPMCGPSNLPVEISTFLLPWRVASTSASVMTLQRPLFRGKDRKSVV